MRDSRRWAWVIGLAASCLAGCAASTAPTGWLPRPVDAQKLAYGGWLTLQLRGDSPGVRHEGELLAIQSDSVFIIENEACWGAPTAQVAKASLVSYDSQHDRLGLWTLGGTLSTASHGVGLILTAPVWVLVGAGATSSQSRAPMMQIRGPGTWREARAFARFPQGMAEGLERGALRPKPPSRPK